MKQSFAREVNSPCPPAEAAASLAFLQRLAGATEQAGPLEEGTTEIPGTFTNETCARTVQAFATVMRFG